MSSSNIDNFIQIAEDVEISAEKTFKSSQIISFQIRPKEKVLFEKMIFGLIEQKIARQHDIIVSKSHYIPTKSEIDVISDLRFLKDTWKKLNSLRKVHLAYQKTCVRYLQKKHFYLPKLYEKIEELNIITEYIFQKISTI